MDVLKALIGDKEENVVLASEVTELQKQIDEAKTKLTNATAQIARINKEKEDAAADKTTLTSELSTKDQAIADTTTQLNALREEHAKIARNLAATKLLANKVPDSVLDKYILPNLTDESISDPEVFLQQIKTDFPNYFGDKSGTFQELNNTGGTGKGSEGGKKISTLGDLAGMSIAEINAAFDQLKK